ncbi:MAG: alpha/beta hydrolase [Bryobacterales bacterium]|nr:alpha/beta hydrolase [Bryobacterales bacterium]
MTPEFVHRYVPGSNGRTLLLLHGTGGDENDLLGLGRELDPEAALLSPRGKVLENGMPRFFRRLAEGVFDLEDLRMRTGELAQFLDRAAEQYGFDQRRVVAAGYSNGANIAASLLLRHPGLLSGAILYRPMLPFEPETQPDLHDVRVWMGAGRADRVIPAGSAQKLQSVLVAAGAEVTFYWHPGGHELGQGDLTNARVWLGAINPPPDVSGS